MEIFPCLWFDDRAAAAAALYTALLPRSRVLSTVLSPEAAPGPTGEVMVVEIELDGSRVMLLNGGSLFPPSPAFSLVVEVDSQEGLDRVWDGLLADGGNPSRCGWLTDRFGVSWQVVPRLIRELATEPERYARAMEVVMRMDKRDVAAIAAAADGGAPSA